MLTKTGVTATERIITGTGTSISLAPDTSIELRYDTTTQRWRSLRRVVPVSPPSVPLAVLQTLTVQTITGNTINLTVADVTNGGVVSNTTQTFAGAKTFAALLTGQLVQTVSGAAISLNDLATSTPPLTRCLNWLESYHW